MGSFTLNWTNGTDAQFRAWGSAIAAQLAALGLVQTSDSGQINWSTVLTPSSTNQVRGYEVWRFADSLQATAPVFIKLEYGSAQNQIIPNIWVTVGTGSDGAGNLTGTAITAVTNAITTRNPIMTGHSSTSAFSSPASNGTSYSNGDSGCLMLLLNPNVGGSAGISGVFLLIERHRNWDGTVSGDGVNVMYGCGPQGSTVGFMQKQSLSYLPVAANPGLVVQSGLGAHSRDSLGYTTYDKGGTMYPDPVLMGGPGSGGPSQYVMVCGAADYGPGNTFSMTHYGVSKTWYPAGPGLSTAAYGWGSTQRDSSLGGSLIGSFIARID